MSAQGDMAARVRAARERLGWTREALAFHAGVSVAAIAQVETGRRTNIRPSTLAPLAGALAVSTDYLVDGRPGPRTMLEHSAFPYGSDDQFQATMGRFLEEGLERREAVLAVTTSANAALLRDHLGDEARAVEFADASAFYRTPSAALEGFKAFSALSLERGAAWVRVLGEPLWPAGSEAGVRMWTRYESLFNLVFAASPMTVVCPYDERLLASEVLSGACLTHPHLLGDAGTAPSPDYAGPGRLALLAE
jgi:transcriptional regulator with XRE-family HTH domain